MSVIPHLELIRALKKEWAIEPGDSDSEEKLTGLLAASINQLIVEDFPRLVSILYRLDIDEQKLKSMLSQYTRADAGKVIAHLIIERQKEKIRTRREYKMPDRDDSSAEKW